MAVQPELCRTCSETLKTCFLITQLICYLQIFNEEIFGEVAEEKEVDGITTKLFEAKSSKSYESYELMARYIGKGSLMVFVEPLKKVRRNYQ